MEDVIMFCPNCKAVFVTNEDTDIEIFQDKFGEPNEFCITCINCTDAVNIENCRFSTFNLLNEYRCNKCECGEDYIYLDDLSKYDLFIFLTK